MSRRLQHLRLPVAPTVTANTLVQCTACGRTDYLTVQHDNHNLCGACLRTQAPEVYAVLRWRYTSAAHSALADLQRCA